MGARGKVKTLGDRIPVRFYADTEAEIRVLAAMWSTSVPNVVRILTGEALRTRNPDRNGTAGMSRKIDVSDPDNLSDEDRAYLASRGVTPEQEAARQERVELYAQRNAEEIDAAMELDAQDLAYRRRTGQTG